MISLAASMSCVFIESAGVKSWAVPERGFIHKEMLSSTMIDCVHFTGLKFV